MKKEIELPLRVSDIHEIIPHRYPFLLIDMITQFSDGQTISGVKNVTANEPFFQGHFPDRPIMPGVLILEAMAQLGAVFAKLSTDGANEDNLILFSGCDKVRFRRPVIPGDILHINLVNETRRSSFWRMGGVAFVDGKKVADAIIMAAIV